MKHFVFAYLLLLTTIQRSHAQERICATHEYLQQQLQANPLLAQKIAAIESFRGSEIVLNGASGESADPVITIPVVVHILYNSTANNISDEQIRSQLAVLNKDFRKLNKDTINTPAVFRSLAADCQIQFELAKITPAGKATTGIVRKFSSIQMFSLDDRIKYASKGGDDAWDASSYLNIWVGPLAGGLLGYTSTLGCAKEIDGVVVAPTAFGTVGSAGAPFNGGRTATHEIGHWLGLRHIWGDMYCGNDYVDDTPPQRSSTSGCPSGVVITCENNPSGNMYSNYMDFTYDACMNLFTLGQRDKMRNLFLPGGARYSLLFSQAITGTPIKDTVATQAEEPAAAPAVYARAYPNPAYNTITIDAGSDAFNGRMYSIHNQFGQQVMIGRITSSITQLNIQTFRNGIYYIRINGINKAIKIVKSNE